MSSAPSPGYEPVTVALVTGITGQDGSYLLERLLADGVEVHGMVRAGEVLPPEVRDALPQIELHVGDLTDGHRLAALVQEVTPDEIYNLAGLSSVALSWLEPALTGAVNGVAVAHLLEAAWQLQESRGRRVGFVQASSAEIFGQPATSPQDELTAVAPTNPYGAAKAYAHHMVGIYRARGLGASSCILFNSSPPADRGPSSPARSPKQLPGSPATAAAKSSSGTLRCAETGDGRPTMSTLSCEPPATRLATISSSRPGELTRSPSSLPPRSPASASQTGSNGSRLIPSSSARSTPPNS